MDMSTNVSVKEAFVNGIAFGLVKSKVRVEVLPAGIVAKLNDLTMVGACAVTVKSAEAVVPLKLTGPLAVGLPVVLVIGPTVELVTFNTA